MSGPMMPTLGLIASRGYRHPEAPPARSLANLLLTYEEAFKRHYTYVTRGTYNQSIGAVAYSSSEPWHPRIPGLAGKVLRMGKRGGIIEMAGLVESSAPTERRLRTLIFLAHPEDVEENYPEDVALVRSAIRNNIVLLTTFKTVTLWAALELCAPLEEQNRTAISSDVMPKATLNEDTLALVAHNKKKLELLRWVVRHRKRLSNFRRIIATGTTGGWVQDFLRAADVDVEVDPRYSGPEGGDVEIANAVLEGECQHVVFFVDPSTSHPHQADIQALLRVCAMDDTEVNLRLNEASADSWIRTVAATKDS